MFRFVVCIDVQAKNLREAYQTLYQQMMNLGLSWETTDEAYAPDGHEIDPDILEQEILKELECH